MKTNLLIILLSSCFIIFSFSNSKKPSAKSALKTLNGFCQYIPSGSTNILDKDVSIQAFYMSATEITNIQYREFLFDLKRRNELEKFELANIDSANWVNKLGYGEPYKQHYHVHPAYNSYPVVNISKKGAELFCEWLTEKYDSISNGELKLKFRIPTRVEWIYAANGGDENKMYAWAGPYLNNNDGMPQANFLRFGSRNITRNQETGELEVVRIDMKKYSEPILDDADVTAPAKSYWPNEHGLYNMNGNVSEMIADGNFAVGGDWKSPGYDVRNESIRPFDNPESNTGFRVVASYIESDR